MPVTLATTGWSLSLPDGWVEVDVDPATSRATTKALVGHASAHVPEIKVNRDRWESLIQNAISELQDASIDRCACWVENISEHITIEASIVVTARQIQEGNDVRQIVSAFESSGEVSAFSVVSLRGVDAVRVVTDQSKKVAFSNGTTATFHHHLRQYFVPVPHSTNTVLVITFATPTTALLDDLALLFDDIAESLQINP